MQNDQYIHELITRKLTGHIEPEEEQELEQMMREDEGVRALYEELRSRYSDDIDDNFNRLEKEVAWADLSELKVISQKRRFKRVARWSSIAAAAVVVMMVGIFVYNNSGKPGTGTESFGGKGISLTTASGATVNLSTQGGDIKTDEVLLQNNNNRLSYTPGSVTSTGEERQFSVNTLHVPKGMTYQVRLADGSEIQLNSATTLQFPFAFGENREVTIKGEAYLKIAQNAERPFIVHLRGESQDQADEVTIQVLGTEFNINSYDAERLQVALVNGAVQLKVAEKLVALKPGMRAVYSTHEGISTHKFDVEEVTGWIKGKYYFQDATLEQIAKVLPIRAGVETIIDNKTIGTKRFTGVFNRNKPLNSFLENLKLTMQIDYYFTADSTLHFK
ncbi:FecR family protein [Chitinophaga japonensis]|uniref:FecR family protein n=1 Tax=Chitinophaga japonensis TaxID=104662 RepID=A0A562T2Y3_CHIJA|nr:FecR domain-containing protein [Chitinophaga japonensis]TWI87783.1 FecR family protein [Chitinophaga japonensis]